MTTGKQQSPIDVSKFDVIAYTQRFLNVARFVDLCFVSLFDVVAYTQRFLNIYVTHTHTNFLNIYIHTHRWKPETLSWKIPLVASSTSDSFATSAELFTGYTYLVEHVQAALTFGGIQVGH